MDHAPSLSLDLLAEIDALLEEVRAYRDALPDWTPSRYARLSVERLLERIDQVRIRWDAPLVVALVGGSGTGKSALVNALCGSVVSPAGRNRPTTRRPIVVCRAEITPAMLGIPPETVDVAPRETAALRDWVLVDCPDPDTAEDAEARQSNTARLRAILPHCDVLIVTGTQQKYRSATVLRELAAAATGTRLVFVQTHADTEDDIRDDWRAQLAESYVTGEMFFVDSNAALVDSSAGVSPRGEFGRLVEYLTRELSRAAATRIRRANTLDLLDQTLSGCREKWAASMTQLDAVEQAIREQRSRLAAQFAARMQDELLATRRSWESRLLGEVAARWGLSPFSLVVRVYQGLGALVSGAAFWRVRTPAQLALWGALEGTRRLKSLQEQRSAEEAGSRALAESWGDTELRTALIVVQGYAHEAGLDGVTHLAAELPREMSAAGQQFVDHAAGELQELVKRVAARQSGWFTRLWYEGCLMLMLGLILYRLAKNFFYDSWLGAELGLLLAPQPLLGVDFFLAAGVLLVLWCALLVTLLTRRLRRGLKVQIAQLTARWHDAQATAALFAGLEERLRVIRRSFSTLERLLTHTRTLSARLATSDASLGRRVVEKLP